MLDRWGSLSLRDRAFVTCAMRKFAETCEAIAGTTKKLLKIGIVAEYFRSRTVEEASVSAVFLSGRPFPAYDETTLQVGGRLLWQVLEELSEKSAAELSAAYRRFGDLGAVAGEVLGDSGRGEEDTPGVRSFDSAQGRLPRASVPTHELSAIEAENYFRRIAAARGPAAKGALVRELLERATPLEAKYLVKIMTGDLRIGLKESLVEEAIARAYDATLAQVQRGNMLVGDIGETLRLAARGALGEAHMRMFHPLGFMLASPAESAEGALSYFEQASVEDKYDGIRAQAHVSAGEVRFFSRTRDEITESFPELPDALAGLPQDAILDGEIVAWSYDGLENVAPVSVRLSAEPPARRAGSGAESAVRETGRALPFSALQQRLGRKQVSQKLMDHVPVAYLVFDVLYARGELLLERSLLEREKILDALLAAPRKT